MSNLINITSDPKQAINNAINSRVHQINTQYPAKVASVSGNTVTVQPQIQSFYLDENNNLQTCDYPLVENVPILMLGKPSASVSTPVVVGDSGLCLVMQADSGSFFFGDEISVCRKHDLVDSVFIPFYKATPSSDLVISCGENKVDISNTGIEVFSESSINIYNTTGNLIQILIQCMTIISGLTTQTNDTLSSSTIAALQTQIELLNSFVSSGVK